MSDPAAPLPGYTIYDPWDPFEMNAGPFHGIAGGGGPPRFALRAEQRHCNRSGTVHGGLLMTMADLMLCVTATHDLPGERAITVAFNASFLAAGRLGDVIAASGEVTRRTRSLVFVQGRIASGDRVLMTCDAVVKRAPRPPDDPAARPPPDA